MKTTLRFAFLSIACVALAGCSGLPSEYLATSGTAAQVRAADSEGAVAPAQDTPMEQDRLVSTATGSVPEAAERSVVEQGSNHGPSVFVQENRRLFAKDKDLQPWPKSDTPEGKRQERHDQDREKKLKSVITICRDC